MLKVNIYVLGKKGETALKEMDPTFHSFIHYVIIGTDSNVQNDYSTQIAEWCNENGILYCIQNKTLVTDMPSLYNIAIGWRWLILDSNPLIVFHDSLLPKYRGFNPLVSALINGDEEIGVTALRGIDEYDAGPIYGQLKTQIEYPIKIEEAIDKVASLYGSLLNKILFQIKKGELVERIQDSKLATYSLWRDEEDYFIDWSESSDTICRTINALGFPYKGARALLDGNVVIILDSQTAQDVYIVNRQPGKVLKKDALTFYIVCGEGILRVDSFYDEEYKLLDLSKRFRLRFK